MFKNASYVKFSVCVGAGGIKYQARLKKDATTLGLTQNESFRFNYSDSGNKQTKKRLQFIK